MPALLILHALLSLIRRPQRVILLLACALLSPAHAQNYTISTVAGNGSYGYNGDGVAATSANLASPSGVALDSAGNLILTDTGNNRVRKVAAGTGLITTVAGSGSPTFSGDGGPPPVPESMLLAAWRWIAPAISTFPRQATVTASEK